MAVVHNIATEPGDVLVITGQSPTVGVLSFSGYTDQVVGETATRYFHREFSWSNDGIFYTPWQPLTEAALRAIAFDEPAVFFVQLRYIRQGPDATGELQFLGLELKGTFQAPTCENYVVLPRSIFFDLFCFNPDHIALCAVLTRKMYEKGILPAYVQRGDNDDPRVEDSDFIDLWDAICCFFALTILQARKFERLLETEELLREYLVQRGMLLSPAINFVDLRRISAAYYDQVRLRGTMGVFRPRRGPDGLDGEFLRLVGYKPGDELMVAYVPARYRGWALGYSSPLWRGTPPLAGLSKGYADEEELPDPGRFPLIGAGYVTAVATDAPFGTRPALRIAGPPQGVTAGVAPDPGVAPSFYADKILPVSDGVDYQITAWLRLESAEASILELGVHTFDSNRNPLPAERVATGQVSNLFATDLTLPAGNRYYLVRMILFSASEPLSDAPEKATLNVGAGANLRMRAGTAGIVPRLVLRRRPGAAADQPVSLHVAALQVRPLANGHGVTTRVDAQGRRLGSYSTGFLGANHLVSIYARNRSGERSEEELVDLSRRYLLPFNCSPNFTFVS